MSLKHFSTHVYGTGIGSFLFALVELYVRLPSPIVPMAPNMSLTRFNRSNNDRVLMMEVY